MKIKEIIHEILLEDKTCIKIPYGNGMFDIKTSVVTTWIIMAVVFITVLILTHNMKVHNISKRQAAVESFVIWIRGIVNGILGEKASKYCDYIATVLIFLACSNLIGLFGLEPPTGDLNVTAALALMSIILVEAAGISAKGVGGWLKSFLEPLPVVLPMNILEVAIKPLSLCMRLFGNILGATVIMELIKGVVFPAVVPVPFSLYFDIFDGLIQAYVFCFLTSLYLGEAVE